MNLKFKIMRKKTSTALIAVITIVAFIAVYSIRNKTKLVKADTVTVACCDEGTCFLDGKEWDFDPLTIEEIVDK